MRLKSQIIPKVLMVLLFIILITSIDAQCPMCRMSAESNLANGGSEGKGLNAGILYLLSLPYLLVLILGFIWFNKRKSINRDK